MCILFIMHTCFDCCVVYGFIHKSRGDCIMLPQEFLDKMGIDVFAQSIVCGYMSEPVYGIAVSVDSNTGVLKVCDKTASTVKHAYISAINKFAYSNENTAGYALGYYTCMTGDYEIQHMELCSDDEETSEEEEVDE
jgi:hypothetical protein